MKLKYYLRGLGIGIAVTTLVLGLSGRKESLTDEEIKARAAELGMVENTVLSELRETENAAEENTVSTEAETVQSVESETEESEIVESETVESEAVESETASAVTEETETETQTGTTEEETTEAETESEAETVETESETVFLIIHSGDTSWPVAKRAQEAGLVKDAAEFDNFLCDNGYSRYLRAGKYEIHAGASEEEIAKILTQKK